MVTNQEDLEWVNPAPKLTRKQKAKLTRERKKHYKLMEDMRSKIITKYFAEHAKHSIIATDTRYLNSIFEAEDVYCDCKCILTITKKMFEEEYGREYKLILSA